jgi:hypothetical protein
MVKFALTLAIVAVATFGIVRETIFRPVPVMLGSPADQPADGELSVLFIGNSHVYVNNVPALVADMARCNGKPIWYRSAVEGGVTLEWHVSNAQTRNLLRAQRWDFVVIQPQSVEPIASPDDFRSGLNKLVELNH